MKSLFDLGGRACVVVGGGGSIGSAIAVGLALHRADTVVADLDEEGVGKTVARVQGLGRRALGVHCDVTSQGDVERLVEATAEEFGHADVLVYSVGYSFHTEAWDVRIEDWERMIGVNLTGAFRCAQAFGRGMVERKKGSIILISSISGMVGIGRGQAAYCSSKHGLVGLTRELAIEWAPFNVRVNAIAPCQVATAALLRWVEDSEEKGELYDGKGLREHLLSRIPLGRFAEPEECVGPAVFLASDASSMVTGHVLAVDGGYLAM